MDFKLIYLKMNNTFTRFNVVTYEQKSRRISPALLHEGESRMKPRQFNLMKITDNFIRIREPQNRQNHLMAPNPNKRNRLTATLNLHSFNINHYNDMSRK